MKSVITLTKLIALGAVAAVVTASGLLSGPIAAEPPTSVAVEPDKPLTKQEKPKSEVEERTITGFSGRTNAGVVSPYSATTDRAGRFEIRGVGGANQTLHTARADEAPQAKALQGAWLPDELTLKKRSELGQVWESVVTIKDDTFNLSKLMGGKNDLKGTLVFDANDPKAVDLKIAELDLSELLPGYKVPAGTLPAIYKLDGALTLCFPRHYKAKRPTEFAATADQFLVTLRRAPTDFREFPNEITFTATRPDGKPAAGATVCEFMYHREAPDNKGTTAGWQYSNEQRLRADGSLTLKTSAVRGPFVVLDKANGTIAVVPVSPFKLANREFGAALVPGVRVTGSITSDDLKKAGQPIGWTNVSLMSSGHTVASWGSRGEKFEFLAPPGNYTLHADGAEIETKFVDVTVPSNKAEFTVKAIEIPAVAFALLKGKPAPELAGIVGWAGEKTPFADLKGKYVLVEFWGYWCGPCIGSMPALVELHEKYADKGLAIVGVHVDIEGEVNTAAKLDEKIKGYTKEHWKGKKIPFPNALAAGTREGGGDDAKPGGPVAQYGIRGLPTTILIDREGKVVGEFNAREIKDANVQIEKLLRAGK